MEHRSSSRFDDTTDEEETNTTSLGSSLHFEMAEGETLNTNTNTESKTMKEVKLNPPKLFSGKRSEYK
jgi:hypothetical protein